MKKPSGQVSEEPHESDFKGCFNNSRYRGNYSRRNRSRGPNDSRGLNPRTFGSNSREKRNGSSGKDNQSSAAMSPPFAQNIDLADDNQWPSIQESSSSNGGRNRGTNNLATSTQTVSAVSDAMATDGGSISSTENKTSYETHYDNSYRGSSNYRRPSSNYRGSYNQNQSNFQQSYNQGYPQRSYAERNQSSNMNTRGNGGRGPRYNHYSTNPSRGYQQHGFSFKKFNRAYPPHFQTVYLPDPAIIHSPVYDIRYTMGNLIDVVPPIDPIKPKQDLDPLRQVEYYFSEENLNGDVYIRRKMDSEGWVSLETIGEFNRIKNKGLTFDEFLACLSSTDAIEVDFIGKRVRPKNEPTKWPLPEGAELPILVPSSVTDSSAVTAHNITTPVQSVSSNLNQPAESSFNNNPYLYSTSGQVPHYGATGYSMPQMMVPNPPYGFPPRMRNIPHSIYPTSYMPFPYGEMYPDYSANYYSMDVGYPQYYDSQYSTGTFSQPSNSNRRSSYYDAYETESMDAGGGSPETINGSVENNSSSILESPVSDPKSTNIEELVQEMSKVDLGQPPVFSS